MIDPGAEVAPDARIHPTAMVGAGARVGAGCVLHAYAIIGPHTTLGPRCVVHPFAVVGGPAQDRRTDPDAPFRLVCGADNVFREGVTISRGTAHGGGLTRLGDGNLLMAQAHVGHDGRLGDGVTLANPLNSCPQGWRYLISGTICTIKVIMEASIFRIYCAVLLEWEPVFWNMVTLFVILYAMSVLFGVKNADGKDVVLKMIKIVTISVFVTNADIFYTYLYQFFFGFLDDFSALLVSGGSRGVTDYSGLPVFGNPSWNRLDVEGRECVLGSSQLMSINGTAISNFKMPPLECVDSLGNPATPVVDLAAGTATCSDVVRMIGPNAGFEPANIIHTCRCDIEPGAGTTWAFCRTEYPALDMLGRPISAADPANSIMVPLSAAFNAGNDPLADRCITAADCRVAGGSGVFDNVDVIFRNTVGGAEAIGLLGLTFAVSMLLPGVGIILMFLMMTGVVAMFTAFLRIMVAYVTAIMSLVFLMMLAPIFISMLLFSKTQNMFNRWMGSIIAYTFQPVLVLAFLFVIAEASSVNNMLNVINQSKAYEQGEQASYSVGGEDSWQFKFYGPKLKLEYIEPGTNLALVEDSRGVKMFKAGDDVFDKYGGVAPGPMTAAGAPLTANCTYDMEDQENYCLVRPDNQPQYMAKEMIVVILLWLLLGSIVAGFIETVPDLGNKLARFQGVTSTMTLGSSSRSFGQGKDIDASRLDQTLGEGYSATNMLEAAIKGVANRIVPSNVMRGFGVVTNGKPQEEKGLPGTETGKPKSDGSGTGGKGVQEKTGDDEDTDTDTYERRPKDAPK